jgi:AcrR family transcriptional regulator
MSKIEENKEKKRQAILQAAQDVFLCEGYVLASMDRIAVQAKVTKQTIYRYYPSKIDLFKATLQQMGKNSEEHFLVHLQIPDTQEALYKFAKGFIHAHLSNEHLATFRLLIAESAKAPEITRSFFAVGPDDTDEKLSAFFTERLCIDNVQTTVKLWTSMLLAHRSAILIGMDRPSDEQIEAYAAEATNFLLAAVS